MPKMPHRLVRDYLSSGSHDVSVPPVSYSPRRYQAVCKTPGCGWKSPVGTGLEADKALIKHRDETVAAAAVAARRADVPQAGRVAKLRPSAARESVVSRAPGPTAAGEVETFSESQVVPALPRPTASEHRVNTDLHARYRELETRMKARAEADGNLFLPNAEPVEPVDYVFICMEPSLRGWATTDIEGKAKVEAGFRNFVTSTEDFILHFSIRKYLLDTRECYYITDLSKGAMLVDRARDKRTQRYDRWYPLLLEELDIVAKPKARIFAVGKTIDEYLITSGFPRAKTGLIHYSSQGASHWNAAVVRNPYEWRQFVGTVSIRDILETTEAVLDEYVPSRFHAAILERVRKPVLTDSAQKLIFNYKLAFESAVGV